MGSVDARVPQQVPGVIGAGADADEGMSGDAVHAYLPYAQAFRDGIIDGADGQKAPGYGFGEDQEDRRQSQHIQRPLPGIAQAEYADDGDQGQIRPAGEGDGQPCRRPAAAQAKQKTRRARAPAAGPVSGTVPSG